MEVRASLRLTRGVLPAGIRSIAPTNGPTFVVRQGAHTARLEASPGLRRSAATWAAASSPGPPMAISDRHISAPVLFRRCAAENTITVPKTLGEVAPTTYSVP